MPGLAVFNKKVLPNPTGGWGWVTNEEWNYQLWQTAPIQPDNDSEAKFLYTVSGGAWYDGHATQTLGAYIVEFDTGGQLGVISEPPPSPTSDFSIEWASAVTNATLVDAENLFGPPDGSLAFYENGPRTATFTGFNGGDKNELFKDNFASFLGTSTSVLESADFIAFEGNGLGDFPFETSDWVFSDATSTLWVAYSDGLADDARPLLVAYPTGTPPTIDGQVDPGEYAERRSHND